MFNSTLRSGGNPLGRSSGKTSEYCPSNDWRVDEDGCFDEIEFPRELIISSIAAYYSEADPAIESLVPT